MSKTLALFFFLIGATSVVPGCGDDSSTAESCKRGCATAATLKCPNDNAATCESDCNAEAAAFNKTAPGCQSKIKAALACAASRPASDWECDGDGEATPKDTVCKAESDAVIACVLTK